MRNKFLYLIKVSLKRKIDTKWFRIANILIALVIIGTANIDSIINYFGGDFNKPQKIYIIDNTNSSYDIFKQQIDMNESNKEYKLIKYKKTEKELKKDLKNKDIAIVFNNDNEKVLKVKLLSQEYLDILDSKYS